MKTCTKCGISKELDNFYNTKKNDGKKRPSCKMCCHEDTKRARAKDPEKCKIKRSEDYVKNKDRDNSRNRQYYQDNKDEINENSRQYSKDNPELTQERHRKYRENNPEKCRDYQREYVRQRCEDDPLYRLQRNLRSRMSTAFRNRSFRKTQPLMDLLGVESVDWLEKHLISTAISNYGYWADFQEYEIDHIIPINSAKNEDSLMKLVRYDNLQLLYPLHNKEKGDRSDWSLKKSRYRLI